MGDRDRRTNGGDRRSKGRKSLDHRQGYAVGIELGRIEPEEGQHSVSFGLADGCCVATNTVSDSHGYSPAAIMLPVCCGSSQIRNRSCLSTRRSDQPDGEAFKSYTNSRMKGPAVIWFTGAQKSRAA